MFYMGFKVNDKVQSGTGPSMTVLSVTADGATVTCEWWDKGTRHVADFPSDVLVMFVPRPLGIYVV